jgi:quercetin dioxygenase-like cupin family protein
MTVRSGERFESRWSRQRAALRVTGAQSKGELVRIEFTAAPGSRVIRHRHLLQTERFELIEGRLRWRVGGRSIEGGPGASIEIPAGVKHGFRNAGSEEARFLVEFRPALRTDELFIDLCELERDALRLRKLPDSLSRLSALAAEHGDGFFFLAALPVSFQRALLAGLGAAIGRGERTHSRTSGAGAPKGRRHVGEQGV